MVKPRLREAGVNPGEEVVLVEGWDDEPLAMMYRAADVFVAASHYERFGLPALDAMAVGMSVVVSDRGSLPEAVGDAGSPVQPSAASSVDAVRRAISEGPTPAKKSWTARFEWPASAARYREISDEMSACGATGAQDS